MRRTTVLLIAAVIATGCGDDDGDQSGPTTEAAPPTQQSEATEPSRPPERNELTTCLANADLQLKPGSDPTANGRTRQPLSDAKDAYLGYVEWPSNHVADVYLGDDPDAIEREAQGFVKAFGLDPGKYVHRAGAVVLTFDDPPPTADEVKAVEDCATAG
jgi:hypothetical protein